MSSIGPAAGRRITGAIVAGGANERFGGQPKGLALVGGVRIIDRVASAIRAVTRELVVVANAPDAERWLPDATVRRDAWSQRGSVIGLLGALAGPTTATLVVAWDMPFVGSALLAFLADRLRDGASAVVPESGSGPEPFCAAYTSACIPAIEAGIQRGEFRMSSVVARLPNLVRVSLAEVREFGDPARLFFNVNTREDLRTAERMAASG